MTPRPSSADTPQFDNQIHAHMEAVARAAVGACALYYDGRLSAMTGAELQSIVDYAVRNPVHADQVEGLLNDFSNAVLDDNLSYTDSDAARASLRAYVAGLEGHVERLTEELDIIYAIDVAHRSTPTGEQK